MDIHCPGNYKNKVPSFSTSRELQGTEYTRTFIQ